MTVSPHARPLARCRYTRLSAMYRTRTLSCIRCITSHRRKYDRYAFKGVLAGYLQVNGGLVSEFDFNVIVCHIRTCEAHLGNSGYDRSIH